MLCYLLLSTLVACIAAQGLSGIIATSTTAINQTPSMTSMPNDGRQYYDTNAKVAADTNLATVIELTVLYPPTSTSYEVSSAATTASDAVYTATSYTTSTTYVSTPTRTSLSGASRVTSSLDGSFRAWAGGSIAGMVAAVAGLSWLVL